MKNLVKCIKVVAVFLALGAAVSLCAQSAIEMVTYFPVPYAQYNTITPPADGNLKFDVGTQQNGDFNLVLGKEGAISPLTTENGSSVNLISNTTLGLQTDLYTNTATFGRGTASTSTLTFDNLRISNVSNKANTVESPTWTVDGKFKLKNADLPGCADKVQWQKLDGNKWYLVCGETQGNVCSKVGEACGCDNKGKWETDPNAADAEYPYCKCSADYECGYGPLEKIEQTIWTNEYQCLGSDDLSDKRYDWNLCKTDCGGNYSEEFTGHHQYIDNFKVWANEFECTQCLNTEYKSGYENRCGSYCPSGKSCYQIGYSIITYRAYDPTGSAGKTISCKNNPGWYCPTLEKATLQCAGFSERVKNAPACKPGQGMFDDAPGTVNPGTSSGN